MNNLEFEALWLIYSHLLYNLHKPFFDGSYAQGRNNILTIYSLFSCYIICILLES